MPPKETPPAPTHAGEVANGETTPDAGRIEAGSGLICAVEKGESRGSGAAKEPYANCEAAPMSPIVFNLGNGEYQHEPLEWTLQAEPEAVAR